MRKKCKGIVEAFEVDLLATLKDNELQFYYFQEPFWALKFLDSQLGSPDENTLMPQPHN